MQKSKISFTDIFEYCNNEDQKTLSKKAPVHEVLLDMAVNQLPGPVYKYGSYKDKDCSFIDSNDMYYWGSNKNPIDHYHNKKWKNLAEFVRIKNGKIIGKKKD